VLVGARRNQKLTQSELASRLSRRQQFVSKYESFERRLDVLEFVEIAQALSVDWSKELNAILKGTSHHLG
jgi:transcriptional regulator with XRE-family HTH domain